MVLVKVAGISMVLVVINALIASYQELGLDERTKEDVSDYEKLCQIRKELETILMRIEKHKN